jgi:phospholipid/cholesterol/gamma-HCH transport system substrate-binding protein
VQALKVLRNPRLVGLLALIFATVAGLVAAMVYVTPPGNKIVTFYTDDASSISPGITVRIAGVMVGKIKDLTMEQDEVRVRATVDGGTFVGDRSQVQVRMLTVVGGYYVNIDSLGGSPLGARAIPRERVVLPYSLVRALDDSTKVTEQIQTTPIKATLDEVQQGLSGPNVEVLSSVVDAGTKLTQTLDNQRGQLSSILNLSDEYIEQLSNYREQFQQLIEKISILEATLVLYGKGFRDCLVGLGRVVQAFDPLGKFYMKHRDEFIAKFTHWQQTFQAWADRSGLIVRILQRTRERMYRTLDAQNAPRELLATDLCIPLPGNPC